MPLINGPRVFPIGESAIVPRQDYDAFDVIGAAASMTASGVLMSSLSDAKIDERTLNHFTQNPLTEPNDEEWKRNRVSSIGSFVPYMNEERSQNRLPQMNAKEIRFLLSSESLQDFANKRDKIDRVARSNAIFQENPLTVFGASMAMSMVEPWNLASLPVSLVRATSRAASAARLGALNVGIATAEEAVLRQDDPNRTIGVSASSVALAGVINSGIGAHLSRKKSIQTEHLQAIRKDIDSIDNEGYVVIDVDNLLDDAAQETININLIDSVKELNAALKGVEGVGPKTAEAILERKAALPNGKVNQLSDLFGDDMTPATRARISRVIDSGRIHSANVNNIADETDGIVGAYGLEKIAAVSSPLVSLMRSPFPEIRRGAKELLNVPFLTTDNLKNIPSPVAVESVMDMNRKLGNDLIDDLEYSYYSHMNPGKEASDFTMGRGGRTFRQLGQLGRNVLTGKIGQLMNSPTGVPGKMTFDDFKLKALLHHTGAQVSTDENVIKAAAGIKKFFNAKSDDVKDLVKKLETQYKPSTWVEGVTYTHRIYNKRFIAENPDAFEAFLMDQLVKKHGTMRNAETELKASADQIRMSFRESIDKIAKSPEERIKLEEVFDPTRRGASHNRYWTFIDDADIYNTDFVVKDIEALSNSYIKNVLADSVFMNKYGTLITDEVVNDMRAMIGSRYDLVGRDDLNAALEMDLDRFKAMLQRVRGVYLDPNSPIPGGATQTALENIRKYNNIRIAGSFGIKSLPDIGRQVMHLGFKRAFGPIFSAYAARNKEMMKAFDRAGRELRSINVANEINHSSIVSMMTNTSINNFSSNKITDLISKSNNSMFILNGLSLWNELMKKNAGIGVLDQMIESARLASKGQLRADKATNMAKLGVSEDDLRMLLKEFEAHGESFDGIHLMNFQNWSEEALDRKGSMGLSLADRIQLAVKKEVDTIVVTPGVGDVPLIMENDYVKMFTQYKSFPIAAMNRQTIPLAQNMNNQALAGLLVSVSAAFAANQFLSYARGTEDYQATWEEDLWEALEDSGNLSTIGEFTNYAQMISDGNPMSLGAWATIPSDMMKVFSGLSNENGMSPYEERAAGRLTPYAGLLKILSALPRGAGDMAEQAFTEIQDGF